MEVVKQGGVGYHLAYVMRTPQKLVTLQKVSFSLVAFEVKNLTTAVGPLCK
jgi:phenylalanine-4-hydroxylase